jgi:MraZ protein
LARTPVFFGEHDLLIDEKNRLLIPAQIRKRIDPEVDGKSLFIILRSFEDGFIPWMYPEVFFMNLVNEYAPAGLNPTKEQREHARRMLAMSDELEWDSQGRVVLPAKILGPAKLGTAVTLIGVNEHLELWNRQRWASYRQELISKGDGVEGWPQHPQKIANAENNDGA